MASDRTAGAASTDVEISRWVTEARHIADHTAPNVRVVALRDATEAFYDACKFSNVQIGPAEREILTTVLTMLDDLADATFEQMYRDPAGTPRTVGPDGRVRPIV